MFSTTKKILFILFFSTSLINLSICQSVNPNKEGYEYLALGLVSMNSENYDEAIEYFEKTFDYGVSNGLEILSAESTAYIYLCLVLADNQDKADSLSKYYDELVNTYLTGELTDTTFHYLLTNSGIYYIKATLDPSFINNAIDNYKAILTLSEKSNSFGLSAYVFNEISELFYYQDNSKNFDYYNNQAIEYAEKSKEYFVLGEALFNRANNQTHLESLDLTIKKLRESIIAYENLGVGYFQVESYFILCESLIRINEINKALNEISYYYSISKEYKLDEHIIFSFSMVTRIILQKEETEFSFDKLRLLLKEMGNYDLSKIPSPHLNIIAIFYWDVSEDKGKAQDYFIHAINNWSDIYPFNPFDAYASFLQEVNEIDSSLTTHSMALETYFLLEKKFQREEENSYFQKQAALTCMRIGDIYSQVIYDYKKSLRYYLKGLEINSNILKGGASSSSEIREEDQAFELNIRVAIAYYSLGQYDKVKVFCFDALNCQSNDKSATYSLLALVHWRESEMDSAIYYIDKLLDSDAGFDLKISMATYKLDYAIIKNDNKMTQETIEQIKSFDVLKDKLGKDDPFYYKNIAIQKFYNNDPDYDKYFDIADSIAISSHRYLHSSYIRKNRAVFYYSNKNLISAFAYMDSAISSMNKYLFDLSDSDAITSIVEQNSTSFAPLLLRYGIKNYKITFNNEYLRRIITLSEIVTARSTLNLIRASTIKKSKSNFYNVKISNYQKQISEINNLIVKETKEEQREKLFIERDQIYNKYDFLVSDYNAEINKSNLGEFNPITIGKIQEDVLGENDVVIRYFLSQTQCDAIVFNNSEIWFYELPALKTIELAVKSMRNYFQHYAPNLSSERFTLKKYGYQLYEDLIEPIADKIENKNLIIIPDQVLYYLPFEMLISDTTNFSSGVNFKDINFLIKDHSISYTPSLSLLYYLDKKEPVKTNEVLLVGNSIFGGVQEEDELFTSRGIFAKLNDLEDLPGVEYELKSIRENLDDNYTVNVLLNENATEQQFKQEVNSKDYKYIHIF